MIDFDQGTAAIDAVLVDSRLAHTYRADRRDGAARALGFGAGLDVRAGGRRAASALRAAGGPAEAAAHRDRAGSGNNPRLTCEAYFAITANTVQFGARAQLYAAAYGFSVEGDIGYDVLIQIAPLHFIADFHAKVQLKRGSSNLFSVSLRGRARRAAAAAGERQGVVRDLLVRLLGALRQDAGRRREAAAAGGAWTCSRSSSRRWRTPTSWSVQTREPHGVALRKLGGGHAAGARSARARWWSSSRSCRSTRRATSTLYGGAPVAGARRFHARRPRCNGRASRSTPVRGRFAPAQYFAMSDDEKLAAPSFEEMDAGIVFGGERRELRRSGAGAAGLRVDRDRHACRSRRAAIRATRCRPGSCWGIREPGRRRGRRSGGRGRARFRVPDAPKAAVAGCAAVPDRAASTRARRRRSIPARRAGASTARRSPTLNRGARPLAGRATPTSSRAAGSRWPIRLPT